jgi:hypothetical protein
VRHSKILSGNTPPMKNKCIPLFKHVVSGNITFWERRQSSTLITSLCSSYRHKGSCRMTAIKSGPHTYNSSISTSSIKQGAKILSMTVSVAHLFLHSPQCSIPMGMRHLSGPNFISVTLTSPPPISSWVQEKMSLIFTSRMDCYVVWATSVFPQTSVQRGFGRLTTVGWQDILAWIKLWLFYRNIFIGQNFDKTSASISNLALPLPFPIQPSRSKAYTPLFLLPRGLGNPSRWITCLAFCPPRTTMIVYLWWLIDFRGWPLS